MIDITHDISVIARRCLTRRRPAPSPLPQMLASLMMGAVLTLAGCASAPRPSATPMRVQSAITTEQAQDIAIHALGLVGTPYRYGGNTTEGGFDCSGLLVWALAQFGLSEAIYRVAVHWTGIPVPFHEMGAFNAYAWQFLWFIGLWMGAARSAPDARPLRMPAWLLVLAAGIALYGFYWRHHGPHGQAPFGADDHLNLLFDKWLLGPLRLLDLVALGVLAIGFGPALMRRLPRLHWLEAMGSASLPVFCAHLVAVLLVLAFYGNSQTARPWWGDALLLVAVFGGLYAVARATLWVDERRAARQRLRAVAMAPRSTPS